MKLKLLNIVVATLLFGCASTSVTYNPKEFDTINYQKNVENAVDAADVLNDFDKTKAPKANLEAADFSNLVQADILFNQGDYLKAYPYYQQLSYKYKDPRIIYKAIVCLEHFSATKEQITALDNMVDLFIKVSPDSQLSKIFQVKVALKTNNLSLAETDLDDLMEKNPENGRAILLFISSLLTGDLHNANTETLTEFGNYVASKYKAYPESNLVASINYASANNFDKLSERLDLIHKKFSNWNIPIIWSVSIFSRYGQESQVIEILEHNLKTNQTPDVILQNMYVSTLVKANLLKKATAYSEDSIQKNQNKDNALINLGIISAINADYNSALNNFKSSNLQNPSLSSIVDLSIASIYDYQGKYLDAISYYQKVASKNQFLFQSANLLILSDYTLLGDKAKTNQILDNFASKNKLDNKRTIMLKAGFYAEMQSYEDAYKLLKSGYKQYGNDKDYLYSYASMAAMTKNTRDAIKLYKQYIKLDPKNAFGYNDLAFVYADQTHDYKSAYHYSTLALAINATDPNILDTMGWVYYRLGNYDLALKYVKSSLEKVYSPDSAKHLQTIYLVMGQVDLANKIVILDKKTIQTEMKRQLMEKSIALLMYLQLGQEVKSK